MIKAIIFDFDGVLVLSEVPRFRSVKSIAEKLGVHIPDTAVKQMIGLTTQNFLHQFITIENKEKIIEQILEEHARVYRANITQYIEPVNHSVEFIKHYTGSVRFAIGSMSSNATISLLINHIGIGDKFKVIISKDDVVNHKPDPEVYLKAVEELQVNADECIVVEDTIIGAQAAINANIRCYVLLNGMNSEEDFADLPIAGYIRSIEDFKALVL